MQEKQNTGVDMLGMIPVLTFAFFIISEIFLPWVSLPEMKYEGVKTEYTLWNMGSRIFVIVTVLLFLVAGIMAYRKRGRSVLFVRVALFVAFVCPMLLFLHVYAGKVPVEMNLTAYPYAQILLALLNFIWARRFLDAETQNEMIYVREIKEDKRMGIRTKVSVALILLVIPFFIFFGITFLDNKSDTFVALCIIGAAMLPFFMVFENRKPQVREILLIAVMAAIAVVGRAAFFMIPQFKPVSAIVIITGISLGAEAGFLTGAVAGFVSNFFFGQGPWTPFQMFAFGIIGFLAGLLFCGKKGRLARNKIVMCAYGGIATLVIYGFIMDTSTVLSFAADFQWDSILAVYMSGLPFNIIHGISTIIFLWFLGTPFEKKLERVKKKYGILNV